MRLIYLLSACVLLAVSSVTYWGALSYFRGQEIDRAAARLTLYRSALEAELRRFAHLPFVLSLDPVVADALDAPDTTDLDQRLARFAQSAGIDAIYLMDDTGLTIAASNASRPNTFKGQNYGFRPYFQQARAGQLGEFYGIGATTGQPGYFYALGVNTPAQSGVIAIKVDLSGLQQSWQASGERILLSNADGVVLLASDPAWRYRTLQPLTQDQRSRIVASRQFGAESLAPLDWSSKAGDQTARIGDETLLYLTTGDLPNSWQLHFFFPDDAAVTRASLITGGVLVMGLLAFTAFQVARVRRIGVALRRSEEEEAQLRLANERLAVEIEERRAAQASLQKTQAELERAGRLAALGQLASSVTHELGQPIAAMRNQLAAAELTAGSTPLNDKMQGLVARMEGITRQLKFFSRKGRDSFEDFDLAEVMDNALELLEDRIGQSAVTVTCDKPDTPLTLRANKLRIEQVMTNILRNALDAIEQQPEQNVRVVLGGDDATVWFEVADTGHGLGDKSLDDLREPFATTRESGRGMGLGLTISAGIVSDHGGTITARDRASGGAVFRVDLPRIAEGTAP